MNRTIKDAAVKRFQYEIHDQFRSHLADFVDAYNFGRRLKTLKGLTPYEYICKLWTKDLQSFTLDPLQQIPGLNIYDADTPACLWSIFGFLANHVRYSDDDASDIVRRHYNPFRADVPELGPEWQAMPAGNSVRL